MSNPEIIAAYLASLEARIEAQELRDSDNGARIDALIALCGHTEDDVIAMTFQMTPQQVATAAVGEGGGDGGVVAAKAYSTSGGIGLSGSAWHAVPMTAMQNGGPSGAALTSGGLTVPSDGVYLVLAGVSATPDSNNGRNTRARIVKNGSAIPGAEGWKTHYLDGSNRLDDHVLVEWIDAFTAGDVITVEAQSRASFDTTTTIAGSELTLVKLTGTGNAVAFRGGHINTSGGGSGTADIAFGSSGGTNDGVADDDETECQVLADATLLVLGRTQTASQGSSPFAAGTVELYIETDTGAGRAEVAGTRVPGWLKAQSGSLGYGSQWQTSAILTASAGDTVAIPYEYVGQQGYGDPQSRLLMALADGDDADYLAVSMSARSVTASSTWLTLPVDTVDHAASSAVTFDTGTGVATIAESGLYMVLFMGRYDASIASSGFLNREVRMQDDTSGSFTERGLSHAIGYGQPECSLHSLYVQRYAAGDKIRWQHLGGAVEAAHAWIVRLD